MQPRALSRSAPGIAALAIGWIAALGCKVPDTLGLPCSADEHCDAGQHCGAGGTCEAGPTGSSSDATTASTSDATSGTATTTTAGTESGSTAAVDSSTSSLDTGTTGAACGRALGTCDAIDVLFVVDNSGSMSEDFLELVPAFTNFSRLLEQAIAGPCSFHIGVTTTEEAPDFAAPPCQVLGALSRSGALLDGSPCWGPAAHPPFLTEEDDLSLLGCLLAVGMNYDSNERLVDAMLAAISPGMNAPGGCNEGFLRDDAALLVVFVTDEDDDDDSADPNEAPTRTGSMGDPATWFAAVTAIKPAASTGVLSLLADAPDACASWMPEPGLSDGMGGEYGERMLTFMQFYTGSGFPDHIHAGNVCSSADELMAELGAVTDVIAAVCADAG